MRIARPAFTPFLFVGPVLGHIPPVLIDRILDHALGMMLRDHPEVFDRLATGSGAPGGIVISPSDLGLDLFMVPDPDGPQLRLARDEDRRAARARISGPLPALLELLEGRSDGDALFFSRTLTIEGETDLVVALRNAVDGEDIDIRRTLIQSAGLFRGPFRHILDLAERSYLRAQAGMNRFATVFSGPLERHFDGMRENVGELAGRLDHVEADLRRRKPGPGRARQTAPTTPTTPTDNTNASRPDVFANSRVDDFADPAPVSGAQNPQV